MGEGVGDDGPGGLALDPVVADGAGRVERLLEIARLEDVARPLGVVGPDPGEAVGLELEPDRQCVSVRLGEPLLLPVDLVGDPEEVLDVVADLVGDDIGLGEVAGCAESGPELVVETEIDVDLLVGGQ